MDNITRYAAANTKIKVLEGRLLKNEDYLNLLSKKSVPEIAAYLKNKTHYQDVLDGINENEIHRGRLENLIKESHINGIEKLMYYLNGDYRDFASILFIRYEIEDLKMVLRAIKTGRIGEITKDSLVHITKHSDINKDALLSSGSGIEFIKNLKGTVYYDYLHTFTESKDEVNLFRIEMTLDLAYFDLFYKSLKLIDKTDRKIMEHVQNTNVDLLNIQWIYRGLRFYRLSPEEIFNYTIAYGEEFNRKDIKELCYAKSLQDFINKIMATKYSFLFDNEDTRDIFMERRILRYQYYKVIMPLKKTVDMDISQFIGYALLLENEVRDIISTIENIRYDMPVDEAKKFLIRKL